MDLLGPQLDSIRAQTYGNWVCVVSDDCSSPANFAALQEAVAGDPRFVVSRSRERLGFYHNFERALAMAPADAHYVAMSDQDDVWHPDKLATLLDEIGGAELIYSDARIVRPDGEVVSDTYWARRRNNHSSLLSLLVANSVTGAASLFRRDLLDDALPFPPAQFAHFHDHWIALTALARGRIAFCDRPVYDYVQHGEASLGHAAANQILTLRNRLGDAAARPARARAHVAHALLRRRQPADAGRDRPADALRGPDDRGASGGPSTGSCAPTARRRALGALWARGARELVGRPETLGAEWMLTYAFVWRRLPPPPRATARSGRCGSTRSRRRTSSRRPGEHAAGQRRWRG